MLVVVFVLFPVEEDDLSFSFSKQLQVEKLAAFRILRREDKSLNESCTKHN